MGKLLVTALAGSLLLAGCARWDSVGGSYPHKSSLLPNAQIKLSETISYSLEKIVLTGAGAWILYNIYDPLAPNWEVVEAKVADNVYVLDLKMKRFHTGGSGEAMMVIKRRAEQLRRGKRLCFLSGGGLCRGYRIFDADRTTVCPRAGADGPQQPLIEWACYGLMGTNTSSIRRNPSSKIRVSGGTI